MLKVRLAAASLGIAILLPRVPALLAQAPAAPIPSQILTAKKVFISNAGGEYDAGIWSGGRERSYNEFYAAMKSWGRYELVSSPGDADLVFQVGLRYFTTFPRFKLTVLDPKTQIALWTFVEIVPIDGSQKNRNKNFDNGIDQLVSDLKALTAQPAPVAK